jgi:type III secretion protein C
MPSTPQPRRRAAVPLAACAATTAVVLAAASATPAARATPATPRPQGLSATPAASPAAAAASRLPTRPFVYNAQQIPLVDLLRDFAGAAGVPIVIAEGVAGTVNANFNTTPQNFLDLISRSFALVWYFDGAAIHVYPSHHLQSRLFKLGGPLAVEPETKLRAFGLLDPRYPIRFMPMGSAWLALASGPPRHIEIVEALIAAFGEGEPVPPPPELTRAIALVHASAVDRTVMGTAVPGVVSTLSQMFAQRGEAPAPSAPVKDLMQAQAGGGRTPLDIIEGSAESRARREATMQGIARSLTQGSSSPPQASQPPAPPRAPGAALYVAAPAPAPAPRAPGRVSFTADETTNLVLVRAPADQMPAIEAVIARLDVPREMVEVEASIIDIASDEVESLGFDWRFSDGRETQISPALATPSASGAIPQGGGFNITTLLTAGSNALLARVRALEASGTARVVSQPKVLGAANRTAVLSDKRTASVRVAGNQDARLYSVETGTSLQVTPRIVADPAAPKITLELLIEDGNFSGDAVDGVPIAQRTSISTIATLAEGQALLIGGIAVEGSSDGRSGIPLLSRLPLVGALFRFDASQSSRRQRLFLITPRRVVAAAPAPAPVSLSTEEAPAEGTKVRTP